MRQWRLIYDQPMTGPRNMAVDEAIMRGGHPLPTLRFYRWQPPCLSLGYAQKAADADVGRLATYGWDIVRRPTGGKAILHIDELTYSITLPETHPIAAGGIIESYRRISRALMIGLNRLGVQPRADRRDANAPQTGAVCFQVPSHYEVTYQGRKLIGSAQVRRGGMVLQHGSLPLVGDIGRICDVLTYPDEAAREADRIAVRQRAVTLSEALGQAPITWEAAAYAVVEGVAEAFDVTFGDRPGELTETEMREVDRLSTEVYGHPDWTWMR